MKLFILLLLGLLLSVSCQEVRPKLDALKEEQKKKGSPVPCIARGGPLEVLETKKKKYRPKVFKFEARAKEKGVLVYWSIKENTKIKTFVIEKSLDSLSFEAIATIEDDMHGVLKHYSYMDPFSSSEIIYYRLRELYKDGTNVLTNPFKIELKNTIKTWMFVNRSPHNLSKLKVQLNIKPNQYPVEIQLYNQLGTKIATQKEHQGQFELSLPQVLNEGGTLRATTADQKVLIQQF